MTRRRGWILTASVALAATAVLSFLGRDVGVPVSTALVVLDTLSVTVQDQGRTRARDRYVVAAPVAGHVARATVREGDLVAAGQVLATVAPAPIDPRTVQALRAELGAAQARLEQARLAVADASAVTEQTRTELDRRIPLHEQGALPAETIERFRRAYESALARLETARAAETAALEELTAGRARLAGTEPGDAAPDVAVRSPADGRVLRVLEQSERVVAAGTPLVELADPGGLEVVVDLLTEEAVLVRPGNAMVLSGWGGETDLHGTVRYVEPAAFTEVSALGVEEQRVNVVGDLSFTPAALGAGYRVQAAIVVWRGADVLVVPSGALFQEDSGWYVFRVEGGRARRTPVDVGRRGGERSQVVRGVSEGDRVVLFPPGNLVDGSRVSTEPGG